MQIGLVVLILIDPYQDFVFTWVTIWFCGTLSVSSWSRVRLLRLNIVQLLMRLSKQFGYVNSCLSCIVLLSKLLLSIVIIFFAVYMSSNLVQHLRTKHIEIDIHFVREKVALGQVRVLHVPTTAQFADIFTKGLPSSTFFGYSFQSQHC
jgi:hypothetical protein